MGVSDKDNGYADLVKRVIGLRPVTIRTGILEADGAQPHGEAGDEVTLIEIACFNEFGTATIPERSFIRAWFDEAEADLRAKLTMLMQSVVRGERTRQQVLDTMGAYCVGEIQKRIAEGIAPENAPSTIAQKHSSKPLVDTGQLRSSISYDVKEEGT